MTISVERKRKVHMKKKVENLMKPIAKGTVSALNTVLRIDANSTSCMIVYQPKAPKGLEKFRIDK